LRGTRVNLRLLQIDRHGREHPYQPTKQVSGRFLNTRGNTPAGVSEKEYIRAYNRAHSRVYKAEGYDAANVAMDNGSVRDDAVEELIKAGLLSANFVDNDV
jgi:hypothetical protein